MGGKKLAAPGAVSASGDGPKNTSVRLPAVESPMKDAGFLRSIIDQNPSPVFVVNVHNRELELANEAAGKYREGSSCNSLLYGGCVGSPPSNTCLIPELLRTGKPVKSTHDLCDSEGRVVTKDLICVPVFDGDELTHAIHYLRDRASTSDNQVREKTLSDLRAQKEMAQLYLDIASVVLVSLDPHGRVSMLNRKGCELLGCEPNAAIGLDWFETFIPPRDRRTVRSTFKNILSGEQKQFETFENWVKPLDGEERLILWRNALIKGEDGANIGTLSSGEDITEKKKAERALRESEARFRDLANQLPQTVFEADMDGILTFANNHAFAEYGYTQEDFKKGISVFQLLSQPDVERARQVISSMVYRGTKTLGHEYLAKRKDGSTLPVVIYSAPMYDEGLIVGMRGIVVDVTERKRLEEESIRREKMESVSMLAGGIAHDFNNLLSPILAGATLSQHIVNSIPNLPSEEREELLSLLNDAENASVRASRLTAKMLNLSKGNPPVKKTASLPELVRATTEVVLSGSNVQAEFSIADSAMSSDIDRTQIDQVISNIVTNAKQAMPGGGKIHISISEEEVGPASALPLTAGSYVKIVFCDEGPGIPENALGKIFEPYFSTKGNAGTGLGLATSLNIIKKHDGYLGVESAPGSGATFRIYLPISNSQSSDEGEKQGSVILGEGRILVMDDEAFIRQLAHRALEKIGYQCDCAENGEQAVRMYSDALEEGKPYSAVILDLTIKAGMGGLEALEILKHIDPGVRAIASSGYSETVAQGSFSQHGFSASLPKPYSLTSLSDTLAKIVRND